MKFLLAAVLFAQALFADATLGQVRLVDFTARTPVTISAVTQTGTAVQITTSGAHGLSTGAAIWVFKSDCSVDQDFSTIPCTIQTNTGRGNRGLRYFTVTVVDSTHFNLATEMYSSMPIPDKGAWVSTTTYNAQDVVGKSGIVYIARTATTANLNHTPPNTNYWDVIGVGYTIIPLTTYYIRQGPKVALDGPISKGAWSSSTAYRTHDLVTNGGSSYMAIADNTNHAPPNATYWLQVNPSLIGPGTFSASLRDTSGKANPSPTGGWSPYTQMITLLNKYWAQPAKEFDFIGNSVNNYSNTAATAWFMGGDTQWYNAALKMATEGENYANGSVECDISLAGGAFCGRGGDIDYSRENNQPTALGLSMIWDTLSSAQKAAAADRYLNDNDVKHNGIESNGGTNCTMMTMLNGPAGTITSDNHTVTGTGTTFTSIPDLQPGSVIFYGAQTNRIVLGRVKSIQNNTQLTIEQPTSDPVLGPLVPLLSIVGGVATTTDIVKATGNVPRAHGLASGDHVLIDGTSDPSNTGYYVVDTVTSTTQNGTTAANKFTVVGGFGGGDSTGGTSQKSWVWYYSHPFGYGGEKTCGVIWWTQHHGSNPRRIPGQELTWGANDYVPSAAPDEHRANNRTIVGTVWQAALGLLMGDYDIRATRLAEQALNYYITQHLAQESKSRWTGLNGHGTQYGTHRVDASTAYMAWVVKNSLTVTPPGFITGEYIKDTLRAYSYLAWLGKPQYLMPYENAYEAGFNGGNVSIWLFKGAMMAQALYPTDQYAETFRWLMANRGDFGASGWAQDQTMATVPAYWDPTATQTSLSTLPLQTLLNDNDSDECIASGLYCRPDAQKALAVSTTGWTSTDTQVLIEGQSSLTAGEDGHGEASNVNILQNNGANSQYLLGGHGTECSGYPCSYSPHGGLFNGNVLSVYDPVTATDLTYTVGGFAYNLIDRWAGDSKTGVSNNSYVYARVNMRPNVRNAATGYTDGGATAQSQFPTNANVTRALRNVIHFKNGANQPNYVVVYDDLATSAAHQLRAYWHYQVSTWIQKTSFSNASERHPSWITGYDGTARTVVLDSPNAGRLSTKVLKVAGSDNSNIAMVRDDLDESWCDTVSTHNPEGSCAGNYSKPTGPPPRGSGVMTGTYRVTVCASANGTTCDTETSAEWLTVHRPSLSQAETMPTITQPTCSAVGGNCTAVEIQDPTYPEVAVFARQGGTVSNVSLHTTHSGTATYVITGLVPGNTYDFSRNGTTLASQNVLDGDTSMSVESLSGDIQVSSGAPVGFLTVSAASLSFTCTSSGVASPPQSVLVSATNAILDQWSAAKHQGWLTVSPSSGTAAGSFTASVNCTGLAAGTYTDTISVSSTTASIANSPQIVNVSLTRYSAPSIATTSLPTGATGQDYTASLSASGGKPPYTFAVTVGSLPSGLSMDSQGNITGTPDTVQTANFTVQVTDGQPATATKALSITITGSAPSITLSVLPTSLTLTCSDPATTVTIGSTGGTIDNWTLTSVAQGWLSWSSVTGTAPGSITVTPVCDNLLPGVYTGSISVASTTAGVNNSPVVVPVQLTVIAPPANTGGRVSSRMRQK